MDDAASNGAAAPVIFVTADRLISFAADALMSCGLPQTNALIVANLMIEADLTGAGSHGVFRLPEYVDSLRKGLVNAQAVMRVERHAGSTALVDGDRGMGHLGGAEAAQTAMEIARESGIGWVGVHNSNHAGAGAVYASIPAQNGMIGIYAAVAAANHMAAWGSGQPLLGTNPLAIAVPAGGDSPFVIDIATSVGSFGAVKKRAQNGQPIPEGWMIDRQTGASLTDSNAINQGVLTALGDHKGSGLSIAIGLLAGVLNGAAFGSDIRSFDMPAAAAANVGQLVIALDPSRFMPRPIFESAVARHLEEIAALPPLPGVERVRWPGERRGKLRAERLARGIPLDTELCKRLTTLAQKLGTQPL